MSDNSFLSTSNPVTSLNSCGLTDPIPVFQISTIIRVFCFNHHQKHTAPFYIVSSVHLHSCTLLVIAPLRYSIAIRECVWDISCLSTSKVALGNSMFLFPKFVSVHRGICFYIVLRMVQMEVREEGKYGNGEESEKRHSCG